MAKQAQQKVKNEKELAEWVKQQQDKSHNQ
jgi:hypothetical protein